MAKPPGVVMVCVSVSLCAHVCAYTCILEAPTSGTFSVSGETPWGPMNAVINS